MEELTAYKTIGQKNTHIFGLTHKKCKGFHFMIKNSQKNSLVHFLITLFL